MVTDNSSHPTKSLNVPLVSIAGALALVLTWGPNPFLAGYALVVMVAAIPLLWRPGESPVMLLVFGLQWLQASVKVFDANFLGVPVSDLANFEGDLATSISLSLTGLLVFALGLRYGAGSWHPDVGAQAKSVALKYPVSTWFRWYGVGLVVGVGAQELSYQISALAQPLLALATLKWAFFFMLTFAVFSQPLQGRGLWLLAFGIELALGLGGFFADFKSVLLFAILGLVAAGVRVTAQRAILLAVVAVITVCFAIVWTAVKGDYRSFVNAGEQAQVVVEDYGNRMAYLVQLIDELDGDGLIQGADDFLKRLSYVDFFGAVVSFVPRSVAHTHGEIWMDAISRPFMPRVFFSEKTVIDDSARTNEFTGLEVSGADSGTSISIGYMGESYIDFGPIGMMLPIVALGYALGRVYRWLVVTGPMNGLLGMGMASATLMSFSFLESSITKVFGGFVATLLVVWLLARFVVPRYLAWLVPAPAPQGATEIHPPALL